MSACLEFVALPKAGYVPAMMQQGKIYDCAGVVFWQKKRFVIIAVKAGDCLPSLKQVYVLSHTAAMACCGLACK